MVDARARVLAILQDPHTAPLVRDYFGETDGVPWFTGSWFERIGGGGDTAQTGNRFTADDLVAVEMLSVNVPAQAAIWILGPSASALAGLLAKIPKDLTPADAKGARLLREPDTALHRLWTLLRSQKGVGWVTAGKLCARKRPALAPVYDQHVRAAVGHPRSWWVSVGELFDDDEVVGVLKDLRSTARDTGGDVTLLRVLDIAIWMRQHGYQWLSQERQQLGPMRF